MINVESQRFEVRGSPEAQMMLILALIQFLIEV